MSESIQAERTTKAGYLAMSEMVNTATRLGAMIILARIFSKAEFSSYRQVFLPYVFVMPLLALGLPDGLLYFLSVHKDRARNVLANNLLVLFSTALLFSAFILLGGRYLFSWGFKNPDLASVYLWMVPFAVLSLPIGSVRGCLVVMGQLKSLALFMIANRLVAFGAMAWVAWYTRAFEPTVVAFVIATAVFFPPGMWLMLKSCRTGEWRATKGEIQTQVGYSLPLGLSLIINQASRNLDKIVVAAMCPVEAFAIYVVGAMELPIVNIVANSAAAVITPDFTEYYRTGRKAEMLALWRRATIKCATVIIPVMVFLFFAAKPAVIGIFSESYASSVLIFQIYLFLLPMRMFVFGPVFLATKQTKKIVNRSIVAICLNAILTVGLTWKFEYPGAAVATVLTFVLWIFPYNLVFSCRELDASVAELFDLKKMGLVSVCSLAACCIFFWPQAWRTAWPLVEVSILGVLYFAVAGVLLHLFKLIDIRKVIVGALRSVGVR